MTAPIEPKPPLADLLVKGSSEPDASPSDPARVIVALARLYGEDPAALVEAIRGPGPLARLARKMLGIDVPARRGRPPKDDKNWALLQLVEIARRDGNGKSREAAIEELAAREGRETGADPALIYDRVSRAYDRAQAQWGRPDFPTDLASLFAPPPPKRTDKNRG